MNLCVKYAALVRVIAFNLKNKLPIHIDIEDLIQVGMIGLLEAGARYDPKTGVKFHQFACARIRGAMIDELRRNDWLTRPIRAKAQAISIATEAVTQRLSRKPRDSEIADELGVSIKEYQRSKYNASVKPFSIDSTSVSNEEESFLDHYLPDESDGPEETLAKKQMWTLLTDAINSELTKKQREVIELRLSDRREGRLLAEKYGLTEGAISQLYKAGVVKLRAKLNSDAP